VSEDRDQHPASGTNSIPRIRDGREDDLGYLSDVLARAFTVEPYLLWAFKGSEARRGRRVRSWKQIQLETAFKTHLVVRTTEDLTGVAIWAPPDSKGLRPPPRLLLRALRVVGRDLFRNLRSYRELEGHIPAERHWFLANIGVDPDAQGRGVGSLLVADGLERADEEGLPVILETSNPDNVGYYRRLGFEEFDHYDIPEVGPPRWFFRRDPEPSAKRSSD
jgi:ribosomal protein S18 acetylase RimI-like enzyme